MKNKKNNANCILRFFKKIEIEKNFIFLIKNLKKSLIKFYSWLYIINDKIN